MPASTSRASTQFSSSLTNTQSERCLQFDEEGKPSATMALLTQALTAAITFLSSEDMEAS